MKGTAGAAAAALVAAVCLLLLFSSSASANLVAYYPVDSDYAGVSGSCFTNTPSMYVVNGARRSDGRFSNGLVLAGNNDYAVLDGLSLFPSANSSAFSVAAWIMLTLPANAYTSRQIVYQPSFIDFKLLSAGASKSTNYALQCQMWFSSSVSTTVNSSETTFTKESVFWNHVACVYNTTHLCVVLNSTIIACNQAEARQISRRTARFYVGYSTLSLRGVMDELKFYDHALTTEQLNLLYTGAAGNDLPASATIDSSLLEGDALNAQALTSVSFNGSATDARRAYSGSSGTSLSYRWNVLSSECGMATINDTSAQNPTLSLLNTGSFVLQLCVTDGELSTGTQLQVLVTASRPIVVSQTPGDTLEVPRGSVVSVSVEADGVPEPTYQWQYLILVNRTIIADNSTDDDNGTTIFERAHHERDNPFYEPPQRYWLSRRQAGWEIAEDWLPIEGAVSPDYAINGSQEALNNQTIRCLITSSGGSVASERYVVMVVAATPSASPMVIPGSGGSSSNVGAIVGGVVGGAGGLFCLLLILLAVLAVVLTRHQRGRHAQKKLIQPDYVALAFGDIDNVALPKKKAEHLGRLEQLLVANNGRLTHTILATTSTTDADKLCKAVMCVYEAHHQGFELLEQRITDEVEAASDEGTLFRANSLAAKLFAAYVRIVALPYLWATLVTSVNSLNDNAADAFGQENTSGGGRGTSVGSSKRGRYKRDKLDDDNGDDSGSGTNLDVFSLTSSMEIDPHKMGDASDSTINTLELWLVAQKLFKCIVSSERLMPTQIKHILMHIDAEVGTRFSGQAQFRALGGFLFLRMVCPALLAPQVFGLLDAPPHPVAQRQFILVSKVLQNLANDTLPGAKEQYMEQLNSFITTNKAGLEQFYAKLVSGAQRGKAAMTEVPTKAKQRSLVVVHQWLERNLALVEKALLSSDGDDDGDDHGKPRRQNHHHHQEENRELVEQLKDVLASLGDDASA